MADKPRHAPLTQFPVVDDELVIGGVPVSQLAAQVGQTPFYAYDREAMTRRVYQLREALPDGLSLHYAVKANPMPAVVQHMGGLVDGLDIASHREMRIALDSGTSASEISFAGPGKSDAELCAAIASGVTLNVESELELERAAAQGERLGIQPQVAVRVNPDFELKSSGMKMGGGPRPFGIDAERVPAVLQRIDSLDVHFRGLHIFSGSQNLRAESLVEAQNATFELAYRLCAHWRGNIELLNIGGGFGIPYFPGDVPLELQPVADNLASRMDECAGRLGECEIVLELGRYLVGEAGVYVCQVVDRKESRGQTYLITNGGLHHHLAASGNFGQLLRKNYPVLHATRVLGGERESASVVGPLCTPLDLLADRMQLGKANPGDLIAVLQSGAYGFTASPHNFLSHPHPVEILV
jgi:diaminopimelate decarboxylase